MANGRVPVSRYIRRRWSKSIARGSNSTTPAAAKAATDFDSRIDDNNKQKIDDNKQNGRRGKTKKIKEMHSPVNRLKLIANPSPHFHQNTFQGFG